MQNYRAGPVGPVGARGVPRGTGEGTSGGREVGRETRQEGPAAPQPTSTSGLVKMKPRLDIMCKLNSFGGISQLTWAFDPAYTGE
ncbi:Uncharacterized protein DBV15_06273 [Temnothorax longispinosus]|uniref:Uncharacterized protein n=1 Tax=Temnothorax longispinosus TaxID=300112 RepID=A0A4S2KEB9_9HYME|nr:Uncharacterized protein DBV15_06273 [Temnothorax longispinosus]